MARASGIRDRDQAVEAAFGRAGVDRLLRRARRPSSDRSARPATISPAAAFRTAMSRKAPFLPLSTSSSACALSSASPPRSASGLTRLKPDVFGRDLEAAHRCRFPARRRRSGPTVVISSRPSEPCTTQTPLGAEILQHLGERLDPLAREHADHLALHAGRIGERAEQIEDRAGAEFDPGRADILHRRMMRRREHEADAGLADAARRRPVRRQLDLDAERAQHVGGARARGQRAVAVLGDRHAGAGHDEGRAGRDVERARARRRRCRRCRWRRPAP